MDKKPKKLLYLILFSGELFLVLIAIIILAIKKQSFTSILNQSLTPNFFILLIIILCALIIATFIGFLVIKFPLFEDIKKIINEIVKNYNINFDLSSILNSKISHLWSIFKLLSKSGSGSMKETPIP